MLFQSQIPLVLSEMASAINRTDANERKAETAKRLSYYHDEQLGYLEELLNALFSDPSSMVKVHLNIVKKVINNLAQVYREPPSRNLSGSSKDQDLYKAVVENCALDVKLKQASRYTKLLKTILLRPVWRNKKLDLDILTGNIVDVEAGESPEDLKKVLITNYGNSDRIEDVNYSLWSESVWSLLDFRGNVIEQKPNPYQILPFLPVFDYPSTSSSFWLSGGSDLIALQDAINIKLTDLIYLLSNQSYGVGYIKGAQGGSSVRVDPGSLVELPENGEIGFKSQQAKISEVVDAIDKLIKWACVSNGLSALSMSTDPNKQSGISKAWDSKELAEMRQDDVQLWRGYEKQLFRIMRTVHNTHSDKKLSESAEMAIDFADPQMELDFKSQVEAWDLELSMGVVSPVDIVMEKNPDLKTREDALAHLIRIKEEQRQLND